MSRKKQTHVDREELRENALRPDSHLGYNRDALGVYLMSREAYRIAECQFRRAVWLNPYEPRFKRHLAWCLLKQNRCAEARRSIAEALQQNPDSQEAHTLLRLIDGGTREDPSDSRGRGRA